MSSVLMPTASPNASTAPTPAKAQMSATKKSASKLLTPRSALHTSSVKNTPSSEKRLSRRVSFGQLEGIAQPVRTDRYAMPTPIASKTFNVQVPWAALIIPYVPQHTRCLANLNSGATLTLSCITPPTNLRRSVLPSLAGRLHTPSHRGVAHRRVRHHWHVPSFASLLHGLRSLSALLVRTFVASCPPDTTRPPIADHGGRH